MATIRFEQEALEWHVISALPSGIRDFVHNLPAITCWQIKFFPSGEIELVTEDE